MKFWRNVCGSLLRSGDQRRWLPVLTGLMIVTLVGLCTQSLSATDGSAMEETVNSGGQDRLYWGICLAAALAALAQAWMFFRWMMGRDEGNDRMIELAGHVREGASAYLAQQYKVVVVFFGVIFLYHFFG